MLNFNRFKYRRKCALDFFSERKEKLASVHQSANVAPPESGAKPKERNATHVGTSLSSSSNKSRPKCDDTTVSSSSIRNSEQKTRGINDPFPIKDGMTITEHNGDGVERKNINKPAFSEDDDEDGHSKDKNDRKAYATKVKTFCNAEERLRNLLSCGTQNTALGLQKENSDNDDEDSVVRTKRKRKQTSRNCPLNEKTNTFIKDKKEKSSNFIESKDPSSYGSFKPKSKRKKVIVFDDSDEECDSVPIISRGNEINESEESERNMKNNINGNVERNVDTVRDEHFQGLQEDKNVTSDIDKLRDIYSHLTISEAKEALDLAGNLTDAILNLSSMVVTGDSADTGTSSKQKSIEEYGVRRSKEQMTKRKTETDTVNNGKEDICELVVIDDDDVIDYGDEDDDTEEEESYEMTKKQMKVWSFFQDASVAEIQIVPGCSEKKAVEIVKLRPFEDYHDLVSKVCSIKGCSIKIIEGSVDFINQQEKIEKLMQKCQTMSARISKSIKNMATLKEDGDTTSIDFEDHGFLSEKPSILNPSLELKHYQLSGLNWLVTLHKEGVNGILADQMGLGKTVQALAFIGYLIETGNRGPHVIIVPSSTCDNWVREIETWLPSVSYIQYKGSQEERYALREDILYGEEEFNIIISTYNIAISSPKDRHLFRKLDSHYVILDEAHMLKNMKSNRYKHLMDMKSTRRLLLTGTPLQNNLLEMISLLSFLMPDLFADNINGITLLFGLKTQSSYQDRIIETAKNILKPFILRRTKDIVLKDLPKKIEKLIYCEMTQNQRVFYDTLVKKCRDLNRDSNADFSKHLALLMQLRKTSNHPLLERYLYNEDLLRKMALDYVQQLENADSCFEFVLEDMEVMSDFELHNLCREKYYLNKYCLQKDEVLYSGKFKQLDSLLPKLKSQGSRALLFSQFTLLLDVIEHYLKHRNHRYLRLDGQTPVSVRQSLIDEYNNNEDIFLFLLSTRAGGVGINLTAANAVILHDIDFNPYNDKQAEDRCHRVGQKRDVTIYKLISKESVEEGILTCANKKLKLEKNVAGNLVEDDSASEEVVNYLLASIL